MQTILKTLAITALGGASFFVARAVAQEKAEPPMRGGEDVTVLTDPDKVVNKLHFISQVEAREAQLASTHGQSKEVREYAEEIVKNHKKLSEKVNKYADDHNVVLVQPLRAGAPKTGEAMTPEEKAIQAAFDRYARLSKLEGAEFDRTWLQYVGQEQELNQKIFEASKDRVQDKDLKKIVKDTLDQIKKNRTRTSELMKKVEMEK
jgi:predicted outer membrane protein